MRVRQPIGLLILSALVFWLLDAAIFRSGLYNHIVSPETIGGKLLYTLGYEKARTADPAADVLLLGNSKMEWGFSVKLFEQTHPNSRLHLVQAATSGSTEQWWSYMLDDVDPQRDRYAAIVIPIAGYVPDVHPDDDGNRFDTAQSLAPILRLSAWPGFLAGYGDTRVRWQAAVLAAFSSHDYSLDLQDLLMHPLKRRDLKAWRSAIGPRWMYNELPLAGTTEGLRENDATGRFDSYPAHFTDFKKREADKELEAPAPALRAAVSARNTAFTVSWVQRIATAYANSRTKLIFVDMPRAPLSLPARQPLPDTPDIRSKIILSSNESFLDPSETLSLEQPKFFFDVAHMNAEGQAAFTSKLGSVLEARLAGS